MALDEINATGGVLGQPAKLIIRDDELNAGVALRRYKEMIDAENLSVIGGTLSGGIGVTVNEWACKNNKIYMSFCDSSMGYGKDYCENGFSVGISGYIQGEAIGRYAFTNVGKVLGYHRGRLRMGPRMFERMAERKPEIWRQVFRGHLCPIGD